MLMLKTIEYHDIGSLRKRFVSLEVKIFLLVSVGPFSALLILVFVGIDIIVLYLLSFCHPTFSIHVPFLSLFSFCFRVAIHLLTVKICPSVSYMIGLLYIGTAYAQSFYYRCLVYKKLLVFKLFKKKSCFN